MPFFALRLPSACGLLFCYKCCAYTKDFGDAQPLPDTFGYNGAHTLVTRDIRTPVFRKVVRTFRTLVPITRTLVPTKSFAVLFCGAGLQRLSAAPRGARY